MLPSHVKIHPQHDVDYSSILFRQVTAIIFGPIEGAAVAANRLYSGHIDLFLIIQACGFSIETNIQHSDFALKLRALRSAA